MGNQENQCPYIDSTIDEKFTQMFSLFYPDALNRMRRNHGNFHIAMVLEFPLFIMVKEIKVIFQS